MEGAYKFLLGFLGMVASSVALSIGVYRGPPKKVFEGQLSPETKVVQLENGRCGWLQVPYTKTRITKDGKTVIIYDARQDGKLDRKADAVTIDSVTYRPGKTIQVPVYDASGEIAGYTTAKVPRLTRYESQLSSINEKIEEMRERARTEGIEKITQGDK